MQELLWIKCLKMTVTENIICDSQAWCWPSATEGTAGSRNNNIYIRCCFNLQKINSQSSRTGKEGKGGALKTEAYYLETDYEVS